jgi:tripartite-type tricarboxylate transporter receptor subunit TctC
MKRQFTKQLATLSLVALSLTSLSMTPVQAQEKAPLRIIVGYPPGGSVDVIARLIAESVREEFSTVIVENKPGAGGRIALSQMKTFKPDGQTIIVAPSGPLVIAPHVQKKLEYDPIKDFTPISQLASFQLGIAAGPATGAKNMAEMIAKAKSDPKNATYGSSGAGTLPHFLGVMLEQSSGTTLIHVPFQGGAPANVALLGGHIGYKVDVVSESVELHRAGKVRLIAVSGATRDSQVPEVPTLKESGIDMVATGWFAVYGPAGMNTDQIQKLNQVINAAIKRPANLEKLKGLGLDLIASTPAGLAEAQRADLQRWEKPIKATGIQLD